MYVDVRYGSHTYHSQVLVEVLNKYTVIRD